MGTSFSVVAKLSSMEFTPLCHQHLKFRSHTIVENIKDLERVTF
jgi:hypothetical protein